MVKNVCNYLYLRVMNTLSGETALLKIGRCTSGKSDNTKKQENAPIGRGRKYFLFQVVPFSYKVFFFVEKYGDKCL